MKNMSKEYLSEYGNISKDETKRLSDYLEDHLLHHSKNCVAHEISRISKIKWNEISFIIYLVPKATPRPRSNFNKHIFYVQGGKENKEFFRREFDKLNLDLIYTPMKFVGRSYFPIPKSMNKVDQILAEQGWIRPISKPDFDNLAKTYADMITSTLIYDDALIIDGRMEKYYSWKPRIEISIEYMEDFDSDFNKKKIFKKGGK